MPDNNDGQNNNGGGNGGAGGESTPLVYADWLKDQPEEVTTMLDGHISGLKSALDSERESRKDLEKKVRDLAAKAEKDSDTQKQLVELADRMTETDRRAEFYEEAHQAGVTNLKLAYTVAVQDEMFDRRGRVNFETMKGSYPELFGEAKPPPGNAGSGADNQQPASKTMNDFIRVAAGRKV